MAAALLLDRRISPMTLQTKLGSPQFIALGDSPLTITPWLTTGLYSSSYGKALCVVNTTDGPQSFTIDHRQFQSGDNPVSVYRLSFPDFYTQYLTGSLTSTAYTLQPGETLVLLYHSGPASYVRYVPVRFDLSVAANATQVVVRQIYGYAAALGEAGAASGTVCTKSPCAVPLDLGLGDTYVQVSYLDASNALIAQGEPIKLN